MNQASVFEWHKRFKEGRESVRDDERCGRSNEVRTPELIGQIKNFMDKYRHVPIEIISAQFDVSVGTVHKVIREELKMRKIRTKFVPRVLREDQKERRCHDSRGVVELINSDPTVLDALVNKEYYVEVLREFRKIFRRKRLTLSKSGQWHFHSDNAPVYNSILAPCDFWPKLKDN